MSFLGVFGHVVVDHLFRVPSLPGRDRTVPVVSRTRHFGGTAGNLARAAARLGVPTSLAAFVGEDFPADYREALETEGVDLTDLTAVSGYRTPAAWIFADRDGDQVTFIDQGPMAEAASFAVQEATVRGAEVVHLGTGRPAYYLRVLEAARKEGKRVAFDPSQEIHYVYDARSLRALVDGCDILFGNDLEVRRALELLDLRAPEDLLGRVDLIVRTRGAEGSVVYTLDARWEIPALPPREAVDPTGAGDAYRAGFYAGLSRDLDPPECGLLGAAVASFAIEAEGPQRGLPVWEAAWERARKYRDRVTAI